ncbi:phosphatase PAP2 family protein [Siphonobacter aquaeclarae]|uniref:PAP2 superfamily protein n=1 Tax=Siphonobacter aquaeclarae TaxID=563176 RepID=A0A1G9PZB8_9BACT|nr:phosphatase PAP2 family protein [Siphonobacter aquaeclarae]SDM04084.1 PAP2 superfamily protein [Siphonobacter aquaeclarae]
MRNVLLSALLTLHVLAGFGQVDSTIRKPLWKAAIAPVVFMGAGLATQGAISRDVRTELRKHYPNFHTRADDYLEYTPTIIPLALGAVGVRGKHTFKDQLIITALAQVAAQSITQGLKITVGYPRPDGSSNNSFPSGHTVVAFTGAAILSKEYGDQSIWYSVGGYGVATSVAALRMLNDRHWLADVLFSAGVGIGTTEVVYRCYPWIQRKIFRRDRKIAVMPFYNGAAGGLALVAPL